jgi:hypothetical protein
MSLRAYKKKLQEREAAASETIDTVEESDEDDEPSASRGPANLFALV